MYKHTILFAAVAAVAMLSLAIPSQAATILGDLSGNFAILSGPGGVTFDGNSTISGTVTIGVGAVEYLVVGGGGGGGRTDGYSYTGGGGGGAGGLVDGMLGLATQQQYTVTVGAGGTISGDSKTAGNNGFDSVFGTITGFGGGGGGAASVGKDGGSGGGASSNNTTIRNGGAATQASPGLGNAGGAAVGENSTRGNGAGGGGGASGAGSAVLNNTLNGGNGGAGVSRSITGTAVDYAGGGGGGARNAGTPGDGGLGGGGKGSSSSVSAAAGTPNTGGGGGGGNDNDSRRAAAGGSGVVYVRYAGDGAVATGGTASAIGGTPYTLHSYLSGGSTFDLGAGFDASAQSATFSGNLGGTGGLIKTAAGRLTLSGVNTYTGNTTISAGVLSVATINNGGVAGNLGKATNAAANLVFNGGTLQYTGADASTDRNFTINAAKTATFDITTNNLTVSGASTATTGALTKIGDGTLTLTGANIYTGATAVNEGTLLVNGPGSLASGSTVTVNSGGTLGGTGTINGTVNVLTGGTLAPGASPGTLTIGNALTLAGDALFEIDGTNPGEFDRVVGITDLTYGGTLTIKTASFLGVFDLDLFDFTTRIGTATFSAITDAGGNYTPDQLSMNYGTGLLSATPEPATMALLALGGLGLILGRKRR